MPLTAGTRLGVFEILAPLGMGRMGEVYRARDTKLEREVTVKMLPDTLEEGPVSAPPSDQGIVVAAESSPKTSTSIRWTWIL